MAVDAFIYFQTPSSIDPKGDLSPVGETQDSVFQPLKAFEIKDFSFGVEQAHSVGSATTGAGAGKIKFNEFTIKKPTDQASPIFFKDCVLGIHYSLVVVAIRKAGGSATSSGLPYLEYCFNTVFVTKIEWTGPGDEGPEESITFAYGKLGVRYTRQDQNGMMIQQKVNGWDQQKNTSWTPAKADGF
jgi:type VI secretion system secreted protein Hcp